MIHRITLEEARQQLEKIQSLSEGEKEECDYIRENELKDIIAEYDAEELSDNLEPRFLILM